MQSATLESYISQEFILVPSKNGVKLIPPLKNRENTLSYFPNIKSLLQYKMNIYFLEKDSTVAEINEEALTTCGYQSKQDAVGNTVDIIASKETALKSIAYDQSVINTASLIINEDNHLNKHTNRSLYGINFKMPCYDNLNQLKGIFGCTMMYGSHHFSNCLINLINLGILSNSIVDKVKYGYNVENSDVNDTSQTYQELQYLTLLTEGTNEKTVSVLGTNPEIVNVYPENFNKKLKNKYQNKKNELCCLSNREIECLELLINGNTAKMIAAKLNLSVRTIEHYLDNIKTKLNVTSKYQLIDKALTLGIREM